MHYRRDTPLTFFSLFIFLLSHILNKNSRPQKRHGSARSLKKHPKKMSTGFNGFRTKNVDVMGEKLDLIQFPWFLHSRVFFRIVTIKRSRKKWEEQEIADDQAEGQSVAVWCIAGKNRENYYYYWLNKTERAAL